MVHKNCTAINLYSHISYRAIRNTVQLFKPHHHNARSMFFLQSYKARRSSPDHANGDEGLPAARRHSGTSYPMAPSCKKGHIPILTKSTENRSD